ncbi:MAG TPA: hypothetical protein VGE21_12835, partial [Flavobacteriales bacterium]
MLSLWGGGVASAQPTCSIDIGGDHVLCQGESVTLNAPAAFATRLWSTGATTPSITVNATGDYWCQVSYPSGNLVTNGNFSAGNTGFSNQFTYTPDLWNEPTYFIGPNANWFHNQFTGVGNGNFLMVNAGWQHGWWDVWCQNVPVCPGQTYTLSFRGCALSGTGAPVLEWYVDGNYAAGQYTMPAGPGVWQTYSTNWTAPAGMTSADFCLKIVSTWGVGNDLGIDDISISGTVVLRDEVHVEVTPLPTVNLGPNVILCVGDELLLDATVPGGTYEWQDGSTGPTFNVTGPGLYSVEVTANNCTAIDNINVQYRQLPAVDLGDDLVLCEGETVLLNAFLAGSTYEWQNGSTASTFLVTGPGTYTVEVTRLGCTNSSTIEVVYNPLPVVDLGDDLALCIGDPLVLNATTPGATYEWQDGSTAPTFNVQTGGSYEVEVTLNNCMASDQIDVVVNVPPMVDLGPNVTLCQGEDVTFDLTGLGDEYLWSGGSTSTVLTVGDAGTYQVQVGLNDCFSFDEVEVFVNPIPGVFLGADVELCENDPFTLDATTPGATYVWQDGSTAPTFDVTSTGTYEVEVTVDGCTGVDDVEVTVHEAPDVELGPNVVVCPGASHTFDATTPGATYLWNDGSTDATFTTDQPGTYAVEVMRNGCSFFDEVTLSNFDAQTVYLGPDATACTGTPVPLSIALPGATFLWNTGSTASSILANSTGWFWVDATLNGCTVRDSIHLTFNPYPVVDLADEFLVCPGDAALLDATSPGATYIWNTGAVTPSITAGPGDWWVQVSANDCVTIVDVQVLERTPPPVDLGNDTTLCPGAELQLAITDPVLDVLWSDGTTVPTFTVNTGGSVGVT